MEQPAEINRQLPLQSKKMDTDTELDSGLGSMSMTSSVSASMDSTPAPSSLTETKPHPDNSNSSYSGTPSQPDSMADQKVSSTATYPTQSLESGYHSNYTDTSSLPSSSNKNDQTHSLNKELKPTKTPEKPTVSTTTVTSQPFLGTPNDFLQQLAKKRWYEWNPSKDIKSQITEEFHNKLHAALWAQDEDKEFEAFSAAQEADEHVVALAVLVAKTHKTLNTLNSDRQTILHMAAGYCSARLVRLIITRGADGAIPDVYGDTPLHIAAARGKADVIQALTTTLTKPEVKHPYYRVPYKSLPQDNVQSCNHDGRAPVHLAAQVAHSQPHLEALVALAKYARADMDYRRLGDGYAPSHIAIDNDDLECLRTCLKWKADSEVRNYKAETPQQLAHLRRNTVMVQLCQKFGAGAFQIPYAETESAFSDDEMEVEELMDNMELE